MSYSPWDNEIPNEPQPVDVNPKGWRFLAALACAFIVGFIFGVSVAAAAIG